MSEAHVCPKWAGYFLINPVRKFFHDPRKILSNYIKPGMRLVDYGSAMGWFSLPMAKMVGENGKVYCFDIQPKMLSKLQERAVKAKVGEIIETRLIENGNDVFSDINNTIDFALLYFVAHEVPNQSQVFGILHKLLNSHGKLYFAEPAGHVSRKQFEESVSIAISAGFYLSGTVETGKKLAVIFSKNKE